MKDNVVISESRGEIRLGPSSYDEACSALSHVYLGSGLDKEITSKESWAKLLSYKKDLRRNGAVGKEKTWSGSNESGEATVFQSLQVSYRNPL